MSEYKRAAKYWGTITAESIGIIVLVSLGLLIFLGMRSSDWGKANIVAMGLRVFPFYLVMVGAFVMLMTVTSAFQTFIPMIVAFNSRRKTAIMGVYAYQIITTLFIMLVCAFVWLVLPYVREKNDLMALASILGVICSVNGAGLIMGTVSVKWGKIGVAVVIVVMGIAVGGLGAGAVLLFSQQGRLSFSTTNSTFAVVGVLVFAAGIVFSMLMTRKLEVKI